MAESLILLGLAVGLMLGASSGAEATDVGPLLGRPEAWDYGLPMRSLAAKFTGTEGVVIHIGDSITYAAPYTAWAREGKGKTQEDEAILEWSHCGERNELDGWYLASHEVGDFWSHTAASGIRADQYLTGGYAGMASLDEVIGRYNPQIAIVMLGSNDCWQGRPADEYAADMATIIRKLLDNGTVPVLSTIPQMVPAWELGEQYNKEIWELAERHKLPVIDYYGEIEARQPDGAWNGTLLNKDDPHPTASRAGVTPESAPTPENLRESGYLLRGWLSVRKLIEVKGRVWELETGEHHD